MDQFFLQGICYKAIENKEKVIQILELYNGIKQVITPELKSLSSINIIDAIFRYPIFSINKISKEINTSKAICARVINSLKKMEIVKINKESKGNNPTIIFTELMKIVDDFEPEDLIILKG